ncbi:hypothetical protein [Streptomyces cavernicola]|uniref:TIGR04222 domain-containing membrane protein n=1 Tax=Streptomyces cavernicola TaxID=3043613 RepID=A0ABT6S4I1_9ACTN|nr:hypothetical protein [Streptomyces sp. B-S-A6]MDI3402323.1 hypothetical protein [Streptomyces sp. B-S-A6]
MTAAGKDALRHFRAMGDPGDPVYQVVCGGPRLVPDPTLREQLTTASRMRANSTAASTGAGATPLVFVGGDTSVTWCGGGGSSCGGSSCGGSGDSGSSGGSSCGGGGGGGSSCGGSSGGSSCGGGGGGGCGGGS